MTLFGVRCAIVNLSTYLYAICSNRAKIASITSSWQSDQQNAGTFYPFFRAHAHLDTKRREPYLLPKENMEMIRDSIRLRYSFLPYLYSLFFEAEQSGSPIMQPLWVEFPEEIAVFSIDDHFLLGPSLLVRPVTDQGVYTATVYFPGHQQVWYDIFTYEAFQGEHEENVQAPLNKIPVYQRGGSIIPRKMRIRRSSTLMYDDPITLVVCLDKQGKARGTLYADDYHTFQYRNGNYIFRGFTYKNNKLESKNLSSRTKHPTKEWLEKVIIVGLIKPPSKVELQSDSTSKDLGFTFDSTKNILSIRKPGINIADDWTISIN